MTDSRKARDGAYIESVGNFDPRGEQAFALNEERLAYWLTQGAAMSPRVTALLKRHKKEAKTPAIHTPAEEEATNTQTAASLDTGEQPETEHESSEGGKQ